MERILSWIRENPQLAGIMLFTLVLAIVMTTLTVAMARAGASLRPMIWLGGFVAIVAGPQMVVHLLDGLVLQRARTEDVVRDSGSSQAVVSALMPVPWPVVFGPKADPALMVDPKTPLAPILGDALEAKLSFNAAGESALAARFPTAAAAIRALGVYGNFFAVVEARGSDATGWTARRHGGQGEWVHIVTADTELYAWTGATRDAVLANRARALGPAPEHADVAPNTQSEPAKSPKLVSQRLRTRPGLMAVFVMLNLFAATGWFFKGSAWAVRVDGEQQARPATMASVRESLLALNHRDVPTQATPRADGSIEIDWRYADARWFDLMRWHQMKRTQRLVLIFDEANRTVRVREYWSAFDASVGKDSLRIEWRMNTGIQFFAFEKKRVVGVQLGTNGKPTGELSKAYTFDLQTLKAPVIDAVTRAGWKWQPVTWNAPEWLRWATE